MDRLILPTRINPLWADRFTIIGHIGSRNYKLFQVLFNNKRGSVYVNFPYFPESSGIAAVATLPASGGHETNLELQAEGKLTSHLVKYHHPPDGRAHFSQSGKVRNELMKQSVPLSDLDGHMFTVYIKGIPEFRHLDEDVQTLSTVKNTAVVLSFPEGDPGWIKIVGYWHKRLRASTLYAPFAANGMVGPIIEDAQGLQKVFLSPWNKGAAGTSVMVLEARPLPEFKIHSGSMLVFIGGFDNERVVNDPLQKTTILAFKYPASNVAELQQFMDTIDHHPE